MVDTAAVVGADAVDTVAVGADAAAIGVIAAVAGADAAATAAGATGRFFFGSLTSHSWCN
jgi:hypothetical protein